MGVNLHLLTDSTACNEMADKGRHARPPIVLRQGGVCVEEPCMSRSERGMDGGDDIMVRIRW